MQIDSLEGATDALGSESFLLFKHSHRCSVSVRAFSEYEAFLADHDMPSGWIDVVESREVSAQVTQTTGIQHKSPQALLIRDGEVIWHASHFDITNTALAAAVSA